MGHSNMTTQDNHVAALREALNESWFLACKEIIDRCVAPDMYANARQLLDLAMRKSLSQPMPEAPKPSADDIHSCSLFCNRPECIEAQRDELREAIAKVRGGV